MTRLRIHWPIESSWMLAVTLRVEASRQVDAIAAEHGMALVDPVSWWVQDGRLFVEGETRPLRVPQPGQVPPGYVKRRERVVRVLAERGNPDHRIADILGCSESAIAKVRTGAKPPIAAGRGNPTLATYQPEQVAA